MEVGCSYGYGTCSCKKELDRIFCTGNTAHSDDRDVHCLCYLIYHAYSDRFDDRSGHASGLICHRKCLTIDINLHTGQRIDQGNCVCPACFCRFCDLGDIRYIRCQLHDDRLLRDLLDLSGQLLYMLCILSESKESCIDIRAGNVDLHHIDRFIRKAFYHFKILFRCMSADIDNDLGIVIFQIRNVSFTEQIDSRVLKSDGIHHSTIDFGYTRSRIARPRYICHTFCRHCSKLVQIYKFRKLFS